MNRTAFVAAVTAAAMLLAACQPSATEQTPGPTVSPILQTTSSTPSRSTPSVSSSPPPTADAALLAEATKVNAVIFDLETSLSNIGGVIPPDDLPPEFDKVVMGEAREAMLSTMHNTWEAKIRRTAGEAKLYGTKQVAEQRDGSLIALHSCRDGRGVSYTRDGMTIQGALVTHTSFYKRDKDGLLKMLDWSSERVTSCA
ncbi:hypothetical protein ACQB6R_03160 [Propionibacteriaceae bacterium G1746]